MIQMSSADPRPSAGIKRGRESNPFDNWEDTERVCKLVCSVDVRADDIEAEPKVGNNALQASPKGCKDDLASTDCSFFEVLGVDLLQCHILTLLDARSLARCATVCSRWRALAITDKLWQPLVAAFLAQRAHLPLCLLGRDDVSSRLSQHHLYTLAVTESRQNTLLPTELCGRTWELRLKPPCGPYWLSFDSTQVGKPGLNRYFNCDGSITCDPGDPIWGGHACVWEFVHLEGQDGKTTKHVQVNHWPTLTPRRVRDGRWILENFYGLYITRPDNPAFTGSRSVAKVRKWCCSSCKPPTFGFTF